MFTGIVAEVGAVREIRSRGLTIEAERVLKGLCVGDSVCVNGACLTAVAVESNTFAVDLAEETLQRTNLGLLKAGDGMNLEGAVALGQPMGGHIVQGHVDGTGRVLELQPQDGSTVMRIAAPASVMRYVVEKGFIAVDGISLTVTGRDVSSFTVSVIPYTLQNTVLRYRRVEDVVNLEADILAKYVEQLLKGDPAERP